MANRYFVGGGTGNWNSTTNWSDTDGGASGFSVPINGDNVFLTAASGANTLTINVTSDCTSINCTGFIGTLAGSAILQVRGNLTLGAGMTNSYTGIFSVIAASTINSNGIDINTISTIQSVTYTLASNIKITGTWFTNTGSGPTISGAFNIEVTGTWNCNQTSGAVNFTGGATVSLTGNSTWTGYSIAGIVLIGADVTINSTTTTITGFISLGNNSKITYTAGTMTVTSSTLLFRGTGIVMNTSGMTWNNITCSISGSAITLLSNLNISSVFTMSVASSISGAFNVNTTSLSIAQTLSGTSTLVFNSTGTWSGSGAVTMNTNINTAGTLTISGSVTYATGTLTYTAGTVVTTGSTLNITLTCTLVTNGINWNNVTFAGTAQTFTLSNNFTVNGSLVFLGGSSSTITINGNNIYANGNITMSITSVLGTTKLIIAGTCTYASSSTGVMRLNVDINTASTVTFTGTFRYGNNTLKYITASSVTTTGSTLTLSLVPTLDTNGIVWNNISTGITTGSNLTLTSDLTCSGDFTNSSQFYMVGANLIVGGSFTNASGSILYASTSSIILNGTGTLSCNATANYIALNLTINTSGTITLGAILAYRTGTFTYTAGTVNVGTCVFSLDAATTLNTAGINWHDITISGSTTITNNSSLSITAVLAYALGSVVTFAGTHGWTTATFDIQTSSNVNHILKAGLTYTITTNFISIATTNSNKDTIKSNSAGVQAILTLNYGATQTVGFTNATDIDSSLGQTIYTANGTLSNATNWNTLTAASLGTKLITFVN